MRWIMCIAMTLYCGAAVMGQTLPDLTYDASVHSIDEFMARFNGTECHRQINPHAPDAQRQNLLMLFNALDTTHLNAKLALVDTIMARHTRLSYGSKMWYAEALCQMRHQSRDVTLSLVFRTEQTDKGYDYWALVGADGLLRCGIIDTTRQMRVSPTDNELNFVSLGAIINHRQNRSHIAGCCSRDVELDQLSALVALIQAGDLTFKQCMKVRYHFLNVPGFIFTVEQYVRDSTNAGWLISDVQRADQEQKEEYLLHTLQLRQWYMETDSL